VLASTKSDKLQVIAILGKSTILHERAQLGDDAADKKLVAFLQVIKDDKREKVVQEVRFLMVERQILEVDDLPLEKVTRLLDEIKEYLAGEKMTERHLRLASSVVHGINRLEDDKLRETYFADFGAVFSKSLDKQLSQYGKKLSRKPSQSSSDLVGKPLELTGTTALGTEFDWKQYRGKVILVDFWATWCGPCRRAMPQVKALYEKYQGKGFDIVAISLDRDLDALAKYLKENNIPWTNLAGDATQELARKYGVRGIPTMMLIDQAGKVVDVSHNVAQLAPRIEPLLKPGKPRAKEDQKD
ncbi:MAG: TlpA family protein disulfide reductase, partial [Planctomycetaceae bacterium]|nr:TlpA family protein disulfide reductase [Planctomycetaceae bacterium]